MKRDSRFWSKDINRHANSKWCRTRFSWYRLVFHEHVRFVTYTVLPVRHQVRGRSSHIQVEGVIRMCWQRIYYCLLEAYEVLAISHSPPQIKIELGQRDILTVCLFSTSPLILEVKSRLSTLSRTRSTTDPTRRRTVALSFCCCFCSCC